MVGVAIISHSPHSQHASVLVTITDAGDDGSADAVALVSKQNNAKVATVRRDILED